MKKNNPKTETATPHASAVPRERRGGRERAAKTENYAAGERAREAAYRAAYASDAAKKRIDALPPAVRAQAAREGLLKPRTRPTREQVNAKKGMRLPCNLRAYLILEILSTNKTSRAIARKFGVTPEAVAYYKARLTQALRSRDAKILYRKDESLFFG